ncbi:MAG: MBL fold metallo-hydrolase [Clostridia bacterium]|nr:MBL fold metallo-hydrolase [Clostridia bacterium]
MKVTYLGHSSFLIEGKQKSVVTDPFSDIGYTIERVSADFCTVSHGHFDHAYTCGVDVKEIVTSAKPSFLAIKSYHDANLGALRGENTIFKFEIDGVKFCHLGDLGEYFSTDLVEEIGEVDVLFIPVGGTYTIDYKEAVKYANAINAKVTVPMHYKTPKSTVDVNGVEDFLRRMAGVIRCAKSVEIEEFINAEENVVLAFDSSKF